MDVDTLPPEQSRLLAALTLAAMKRHGGDAVLVDENDQNRELRMLRIHSVALVEHPATSSEPRQINAYAVEDERLFKIEPARLLYVLIWTHRATPPDFHLQLVMKNAREWSRAVVITLLAELRAKDPHLFDDL